MGAGRPDTYDFELCTEICERLYDESLTDVLKNNDKYPARSTFFKWKRENKELSDLYVNIAQDKGILFIEEIDQTIEDLRKGRIEPAAANVIIQSLKWKAAKFYPKMFGEKLDVTTDNKPIENKSINLTIDGKDIDLGV